MAVTSRYERITAHDGGTFEAYSAVPEGGGGPGVLVFQEIFGINDNIRGLADELAGEGYVALVPDMFWRVEPRFERKDESGMADAFAVMQRFDVALAQHDIASTHAHLLSLSECTGTIGAVGFCLGGSLAFASAATSRVDGRGPDAVVSYYGSQVNGMLGMVDAIECPIMFHYGDQDPYIPAENIAEVEKAVSGLRDVEFHHYDAGHTFSNWDAPSMYRKDAADTAWARALSFFTRHLR